MEKNEKLNRRDFISKVFMGTGLVAGIGLFIRHGLAFIFPEKKDEVERKLLVGRRDEFKVGEAKEFNYGERDLFLVRTNDGFKVYSAICTHLGCKIRWEGYRDRFFCPCHKGIFSPSGEVISGPPPRPLDEFKVEVEDNLVYMWMKESSRGLT